MLFWKRRRDKLLQEIETHVEIEVQKNIDAGMVAEEAKSAALKKFGSVLQTVESSRDIWGGARIESLLRDLQYALRNLGTAQGYTTALVLTLALGLGCVIAMLAIVDSVLLRPLALPHPEQLVQLDGEEAHGGPSSQYALSFKQFDDLQRVLHSFAGLSGWNAMVRPVAASDGTRVAVVVAVTPNFFQTFAASAKLGRLISMNDAKAPVAVISNQFWHERLHGDPKAIGSTIKTMTQLRTVIGVLPRNISFPGALDPSAVFIPMSRNAQGEDDFMDDSIQVFARVKPGISVRQALAEAQTAFTHSNSGTDRQKDRLRMRPYQDSITGDLQTPLLALLGGVGALLLIACANATNLQIARTTGRMPEMRVRSALGASFGRLLQQLVVESVLVSLAGAALGGAVAYAAVSWARSTYGGEYPRFDELSIQPAVLVEAALLATVVGVAASLAPALGVRRQTRANPTTRTVTRTSRIPGILIAFQVALTCVLLVTGGLFIQTLRSLENVKLGFDPRNVTTLVLMPVDLHQDTDLSRQIETRLLHRFEALPGVQSVTMQTGIPFSSFNMIANGATDVSARAYREGDMSHYSLVSTDFARTSGIRLLKGRSFLPEDESSAAVAVLVNQAFATQFFAGSEPVGAAVRFHRNPKDTDADLPLTQPMTVVGVVENQMEGGDLSSPYPPMVYLNYLRLPKSSPLTMFFNMAAQYAVRSSLPPYVLAAELRAVLKKEAPEMAEMSLKPMEESISQSLNQRRLALRLVAGFGMMALVLSAVGIYGVLVHWVAMRKREIGVRTALGSSRVQVMTLVVRRAGTMVLAGLIPGIACAWAAGYAVRSFLFGVHLLDPATLVSVTVILLATATTAAFLPAFHAALLDPVVTLRSE